MKSIKFTNRVLNLQNKIFNSIRIEIFIFTIITLYLNFNIMEVDTNFYSRQISTYGLDTMKQIASLNIFIYGMRGVLVN